MASLVTLYDGLEGSGIIEILENDQVGFSSQF